MANSTKSNLAGPTASCDARVWPMTAGAQRQAMAEAQAKVEEQSIHQGHVHDILKDLSFGDMLRAVEAHIQVRPDYEPALAESFGDRISRDAWMKGRE